MIGDTNSSKSRFKFWIRTLKRSSTLTYLFINSFTRESSESIRQNKHHNNPSILQIGSLNIQTQFNTKSPRSFQNKDVNNCLQWLDTQNPCSVLYISFGTWINPIQESKIKTLATSLEESQQPFLWVLALKWRQGLPKGFFDRIMKFGKLVLWAPQKEVLKHKSVGCYLTHCGWNSTMEAIRFQKKLLCYPVAGDQFMNCKYIVEVWRIGVRICDLGKRDLVEGMRMIMENDEMSCRMSELKEMFMGENEVLMAIDMVRGFMECMKM